MIRPMTRSVGRELVNELGGRLLARCIDDDGHESREAYAVREARRLLIEAGF